MGRRSKLNDKQWESIGARLLAGESARALGREFKVAESTIRERFSSHHKQIKIAANHIVETTAVLNALPLSAQITAHNLADQLISISSHLAGAARYGAMTAHRLAGIAHSRTDRIDEADIASSIETMKEVSALTKMSNEASEIGMNLLRANKDKANNGPSSLEELVSGT